MFDSLIAMIGAEN